MIDLCHLYVFLILSIIAIKLMVANLVVEVGDVDFSVAGDVLAAFSVLSVVAEVVVVAVVVVGGVIVAGGAVKRGYCYCYGF